MNLNDKRILVTGSAGFIGNALADTLQSLGGELWNYDIEGGDDVLDYSNLLNTVDRNEIELIYHLAAQPIVPIANKYPYNTLNTNILGTLNVLDVCERYKIPCVIASSDKAYGETADGYTEESALNAKYAYDLSKACADKIAQVYQSRGNVVKVMRLSNVYGPGDTHRTRLVPHVIKSYLNGVRPVLRGDPSMVRPWIYIDDAVQAYINALDDERDIISVGGIPHSVGEVVETIRQLTHGLPPIVEGNTANELQHQLFARIDVADDFEDNIVKTIEWWEKIV